MNVKARIELLAPWATGLLLGVPVLLAYYPPMTDLPYHEASIGLLRHFADPTMCPPGLYAKNLGEPNQLFHMVGWALAYLVPTRWAVKLLIFAAVVAIPTCGARLARHAETSPLAALALSPIALGWLFGWGLVANLLGLAALLFALPIADAYAMQPTRARLAWMLGAVALLYFAHEAMLIFFAGVAVLLALIHPPCRKRTPLRLLPLVACGAVVLLQLRWQERYMTPEVRAVPIIWHPVLNKIIQLPYFITPTLDLVAQLSVFSLLCLTIGSLLFLRQRERRASGSLRAQALAHRWELMALCGFVAYLAFPHTLHGATLVYQRWLFPALALLVLGAAPRDLWVRPARLTRLTLAALPLATLFVAWPTFADASRQQRALSHLIPLIEAGSATAELEVGPRNIDRGFSLASSAGRALALKGGRLAYSFADSSISPVIIPPALQWQEPLLRFSNDPMEFRPTHDFRRFRYALVHTSDVRVAPLAAMALRPEARVLGQSGEWTLFESQLPVVSVLSPDVPMEDPPPPSLGERLRDILAAQRP